MTATKVMTATMQLTIKRQKMKSAISHCKKKKSHFIYQILLFLLLETYLLFIIYYSFVVFVVSMKKRGQRARDSHMIYYERKDDRTKT